MNPGNFIKETRRELMRVTWPTRAELIQMTALVIVVSLAVGAYIGLLDLGLSKGLETLLK